MSNVLDCFEQWINEVVDCQYDKGKWPWTASAKNTAFKTKFHEMGKELGFVSRYSGKNLIETTKDKNQEFLYDFTWLKRDGEILQSVYLAMELEFSDHEMRKGMRGGIKYDFHKLLQADAPFKLMGFQMAKEKGEKGVKKAIEEMETAVKSYQSRMHSEILIFGWAWDDGPRNDENRRQFIYHQITQKP